MLNLHFVSIVKVKHKITYRQLNILKCYVC
jgi:hypothetical protein